LFDSQLKQSCDQMVNHFCVALKHASLMTVTPLLCRLPCFPHLIAVLLLLLLLHCTFYFVFLCVFWHLPPSFFLPAFQSELRHGPFYYMKQPALTTDPVDVVPQDGRNDFYCWLCHREGQVLCCELCPRVYHAKCLKLPAEPEGDWFCPECEVSRGRRECVWLCTEWLWRDTIMLA